MKKMFLIFAFAGLAAGANVYAQENASGASWMYMTVEDFVNDNRSSEGLYDVPFAKGEGEYKDSLELVYAPARIDGDRKSDVSKDAWGIVSGGQLYVNNKELNGEKGYSKSFAAGRYNLFFTQVKESGSAREKFGYTKDDVRYYNKEQGRHRGTVNVGGIPIGLGQATLVFIPVVTDRTTGEMKACSQALMQELGARHPAVPPVPMEEARGVRLIEYFRALNSAE